MEKERLDFISETYETLVQNPRIPKMEMKLIDGGKIAVYRVGDLIRIDIKNEDTKRR